MQLGIFMPTQSGGWVMSKSSPRFVPDWFLMEQTASKAEYYDFDFLLAPVKLRGFGGETEFWNHTLDSMTVIAGLAVRTKRIRLYGSLSTLMVPPPLAAKQAATITDMAGGRFGINIVSGWEKPEYTQMGLWPGDEHFHTRYERAAEYVQIMRELWDNGHSDLKGRFYRMDDCAIGPRPRHRIEIVCAGQSEDGMRFTARVGDYQFLLGAGDVVGLHEQNARLLRLAAEAGRLGEVSTMPVYTIVVRDTEDQALAVVADWREHIDVEAVATMLGVTDTDASEGRSTELLRSNAFLFGHSVIAGDAHTVAERLMELADVEGVGGIVCAFQDYLRDIDRFGREVMPLLRRWSAANVTGDPHFGSHR